MNKLLTEKDTELLELNKLMNFDKFNACLIEIAVKYSMDT